MALQPRRQPSSNFHYNWHCGSSIQIEGRVQFLSVSMWNNPYFTSHHHLVPRSRMSGAVAHLHSSLRLHGVVRGTTLPLFTLHDGGWHKLQIFEIFYPAFLSWGSEIGLCAQNSVCVFPSFNSWISLPIFRKFGKHVMQLEASPTSVISNFPQSVITTCGRTKIWGGKDTNATE
jgi:hypothetical protein